MYPIEAGTNRPQDVITKIVDRAPRSQPFDRAILQCQNVHDHAVRGEGQPLPIGNTRTRVDRLVRRQPKRVLIEQSTTFKQSTEVGRPRQTSATGTESRRIAAGGSETGFRHQVANGDIDRETEHQVVLQQRSIRSSSTTKDCSPETPEHPVTLRKRSRIGRVQRPKMSPPSDLLCIGASSDERRR